MRSSGPPLGLGNALVRCDQLFTIAIGETHARQHVAVLPVDTPETATITVYVSCSVYEDYADYADYDLESGQLRTYVRY